MNIPWHIAMLWLVMIQYCIGQSINCPFKCRWTVSNYTLDLTAFQLVGANLSMFDSPYWYHYSPCNNLLGGYGTDTKGPEYMIGTVDHGIKETILGYADLNVEPTIKFNKDSNIVWNFKYNSNFSIEFICNHSAPFLNITQILEIMPNVYLMEISTMFACNDSIANYSYNSNQCRWNNSNMYSLDLSPLFGTNIEWVVHETDDIYDQYFNYYVCQDYYYGGKKDHNSCGMLGFHYYNSVEYLLYLYFDKLIEPIYNITEKSWTFVYNIINPRSYEDYYKYYTIKWICDPNVVTYKVLSYSEAYHSDMSLTVSSMYACNRECIFYSNDSKNSLDLSDVAGALIYYVDDDFSYSYQYTPCSNGVTCTYQQKNMAIQWDISGRLCTKDLGEWNGNHDNGYNVSYDSESKHWQFIYHNGGICSKNTTKKNIFSINWKCNKNVAQWNVTKFIIADECTYEMYVESILVCS